MAPASSPDAIRLSATVPVPGRKTSVDGRPSAFYGELASWWPMISPLRGLQGGVEVHLDQLTPGHDPGHDDGARLGSGGGNIAFHLKSEYEMTLVDYLRRCWRMLAGG